MAADQKFVTRQYCTASLKKTHLKHQETCILSNRTPTGNVTEWCWLVQIQQERRHGTFLATEHTLSTHHLCTHSLKKGVLICWLVSWLPHYHTTLANLSCQSSRKEEWGIKSLGFLTILRTKSKFVASVVIWCNSVNFKAESKYSKIVWHFSVKFPSFSFELP
jgi:hypothetical protein